MFDYIKELYQNQLYHDVIDLIRFYDTGVNRLKETFGIGDGINILFIYASSLYYTKEYKLALQLFQNALTYYSDHFSYFQKDTSKPALKRKNSSSIDSTESLSSLTNSFSNTVEIKYRMHLCYKELGQYNCAIHTLQSIPQEMLSLKILIAFGDLYIETNNTKEALNCYMNAVLKNPLALNTIKKILNYASHSVAEEFVQLLSKKISEELNTVYSGQLNRLIYAYNISRMPKNFKKAYHIFFELISAKSSNVNDNNLVSVPRKNQFNCNNIYMMLETAKFLYYDGYVTNAVDFYKKIYALNPELIEGVDCYASCLYRDSKFKQLQKLASNVLSICSTFDTTRKLPIRMTDKGSLTECNYSSLMFDRPEPWIVIGYYNLYLKDQKSLLFANKALLIDNTNEEALILKTIIYQKKVSSQYLKSHREFIDEIEQFIFKTKPTKFYVRFEILKYLAESILLNEGRDTAENYVKEAIEKYGMTARICTFYAKLIYMDTNSCSADRKAANKLLEDAVRINPYYLSAVVHLSKVYMRDDNYEKAVQILHKVTEKFDYQFLHKLIYDCYMKMGQEDKALMHQTISCSKNPLDSSDVTSQRLEEENLNVNTSQLDLTSTTSLNLTGENNIDTVELVNIPSTDDDDDDEANRMDIIWN